MLRDRSTGLRGCAAVCTQGCAPKSACARHASCCCIILFGRIMLHQAPTCESLRAHTHTRRQHTHACALSLFLSPSPLATHSLTHFLTHPLTHSISRPHSLPPSLVSVSVSLSPSLPPSHAIFEFILREECRLESELSPRLLQQRNHHPVNNDTARRRRHLPRACSRECCVK